MSPVGPLRTTAGRITAIAIGGTILLAGSLIMLPVLMMMNAATVGGSSNSDTNSAACRPTAVAGGRTLSLTTEQITNAGTIIATGRRLNIPSRGLVVALATALQESVLRNLSGGHLDSVGLFQQRDAWGTFAQRTDPATAATMFYTGGVAGQPGLLDIPDWRRMSVTDAAQAVQRSAFPFAYAKWEPLATSLVRSVMGDVDLGCDAVGAALPSGAVGDMLRVALAQQGDPYLWGATGPDFFDCSGLIVYAWRMAGYQLNVRTANQMYQISTPLRAGEERPGDLLFGDFNGRVRGGAGHVMIVVRPGLAVQAPRSGDVVKLSRYTADGVEWRLGRLPGSALTRLDLSQTAA
jgi:cell wall-associated NlpC family hydrolase